MQTLLDVRQAAELLGIPARTVRHQIKHGEVNAERVPSQGKTGWKYLVPLSSLPPSVQARYLGDTGVMDRKEPRPSVTGYSKGLPDWAEKTALARADLVHAWRDKRDAAKAEGRKVGDTVKAFLNTYNTGDLFPELHKTLGSVSKGTLYRWDKSYSNAGNDYRGLAPEWGCNRGESIVTDEEAKTLLNALLRDNQMKIRKAINYTKTALDIKGEYSPSSSRTLERFIESWKSQNHDLWVLAREGEKALKDRELPYIVRNWDLVEVGDVLVADGHKLNFRVIHPFTGRPCRAAMVMFYDCRARMPLGWEIMPEEDVQTIASAFRMSVITLGKLPKIAYLDNGKGFKAKCFTSDVNLEEHGMVGLYARLGVTAVFAAPYNARAKIIERFFGTFNEWFERLMPSYCGASISDRPARYGRNEKLLRAAHRDFIPTIEEAMQMIARWLEEFYIHQPHSGLKGRTPAEVFEEGRGPGVNERELDFMMMSTKVTKINRNGIRFEHGEYWHEALVGWKEQVAIRYSFNDYKSILVYTKRGEFLCRAERVKECHPMANILGTVEDRAQLKEIQSRHTKVGRHVQGIYKLTKDAVSGDAPYDGLIGRVPRLPEIIEQAEREESVRTAALPDTVTVEAGEAEMMRIDDARQESDLYMDDFEKYDALKGRDDLTENERRWLQQFKQTDLYRCAYAS